LKVTCKRKELLASFGMVSGVVPSRSPRPILQNVHFSATDDGCTLMGTDLEVGIRHRVLGVTVFQPGSAILPTQKLQSILTTSPDAELSIEIDGDMLVIRGHSATFRLPSEDPTLFPAVPAFDAAAYHVVGAADLRKLIRRTMFATDAESTRFALGGVLADLTNGSLVMVGTDGRRLAHATAPAEAIEGATAPAGSPVIPTKALKLIDRNLDDEELSVEIAFTSPSGKADAAPSAIVLRLNDGSATIYSRLVEGRFPRFQEVFPTEHSARIPLDVAALRQSIAQASIMVTEESRGTDLRFGADTLTLESQAPDAGHSKVTMPIEYGGAEVDITFDCRYVSDFLKVTGDESELYAELTDHKSAALFKVDGDYQVVVMPLTRDR